MEIAMLAPVVFETGAAGGVRMMEIIEKARAFFANTPRRSLTGCILLAPKVVLMGGLFYRDSIYTHAFRRRLKKNLPDARVTTANARLSWALHGSRQKRTNTRRFTCSRRNARLRFGCRVNGAAHPRSQNLENMTAHELVQLFVGGGEVVQGRFCGLHRGPCRAIETVTESLRTGGRLFYVGAGSSGRIGV